MTKNCNYQVRWLAWHEYGDQILDLRRQVFVEEQGFGRTWSRTAEIQRASTSERSWTVS